MSNIDVIIRLLAQKDGSIKAAADETQKDMKEMYGSLESMAQKAAMGFAAVSGAMAMMGRSIITQAAEMEQFRGKLETVLHSASAARETLKYAVEFAAKTPFNVREVVSATTQLSVYGANAKQVLPLVANLAAGMGRDIAETALVMGKAWSGSQEGFESLRNTYGITIPKLRQYGAAVNDIGEISMKTSSDIEKNRAALQKIIQLDFSGAVERESRTFKGVLSNLGDATSRLAVALGDRLIPGMTSLARSATQVIEKFEGMPTIWKDIIVGAGLLTGTIATMGAGVAGVVIVYANYKKSLIELGLIKSKLTKTTQALAAAEGEQAAAQGLTNKETQKSIMYQNIFGKGMTSASSLTEKYAGLVSRLPGYLGAAGIAYVGITYALNRYTEEQEKQQQAMAEGSKIFQTAHIGLRKHIDMINEAGKSQGIMAKTCADIGHQLNNISAAMAKMDIVKLRQILSAGGTQGKDVIAEYKKKEEELTTVNKRIEAVKAFNAAQTPEEWRRDKEGNEYLAVRKHLDINAVPESQRAAVQEEVNKGLKSYSSDDYMKGLNEHKGTITASLKILKPPTQDAEEMTKALADMEEPAKKAKAYLDLSDKLKGADAYIERLKTLKGLSNDQSISLIEQGVLKEGTYQEALEKYKTTTNEKEREMLKVFLENKAEEMEAQKKVTDEALKNDEKILEKRISSHKKVIEDDFAMGEITSQQKYDQEVALAAKLRGLVNGAKAEGSITVNGQKYAAGGKEAGPANPEDQKMQHEYKTNAEFRKKVDAELLQLDKSNYTAKKSLQSEVNLAEEGCELVAGADVSERSLEDFKEFAGGHAFITKDYKELLAFKEVEAVFVTTPDFLHEGHALSRVGGWQGCVLGKTDGHNHRWLRQALEDSL